MMKNYFKIILRGIGQVMLQNNALTGLIFLMGIFYNSWIFGLGALLGNLAGTFSARLFKYSDEDIKNGLYGFNGTLVGIAVWYFYDFNFTSALAIIIGAILSTVVMHLMQKRLPPFTAPFVISTWLIIIGLGFFKLASIAPSTLSPVNFFDLFSAITLGSGQVMFQASAATGIIFFIALLVNSRPAAAYALYGSLLGGFFALALALPFNMINLGLFGYNAVLCAIALGEKKFGAFLWATLAILLSVLLNLWLGLAGVITLTAPFVLAAWIILAIKRFFKNKLLK